MGTQLHSQNIHNDDIRIVSCTGEPLMPICCPSCFDLRSGIEIVLKVKQYQRHLQIQSVLSLTITRNWSKRSECTLLTIFF